MAKYPAIGSTIDMKMKTTKMAAIGLVLVWPLLAQGQQNGDVLKNGTLPSGRKFEMIQWAGTEKGHVLISYPANYDPKKTYHINFWFPGTGGNPGPGIEDHNDRYIGILLSYLSKTHTTNKEYAADHWALCRQVEATMQKRNPTRIGQRVVSGVSKGGWIAFFMAADPPQGLNGVAIIAAGRDLGTQKTRDLSMSGLSVLVGTGEVDTNYPTAQLADGFFRKCNLSDYTYEEWLGQGHTSQISPRVQEWLDMVAMRGQPKDAFVKYCDERVLAEWEKIKQLPEVLDQYRAARHLMKSPCMRHASAQSRNKVASWGRELSRQDEVSAWVNAYNVFREVVKSEVGIYEGGFIDIQKVSELDVKYSQIAHHAPYPDIKLRAAYGHMRCRKVGTMLQMQEEAKKHPPFSDAYADVQKCYQRVTESHGRNQALVNQFNDSQIKLAHVHNKLKMDAFYQVEWDGKFTMDEKMKALIQNTPNQYASGWAYSGLNY